LETRAHRRPAHRKSPAGSDGWHGRVRVKEYVENISAYSRGEHQPGETRAAQVILHPVPEYEEEIQIAIQVPDSGVKKEAE
jgi:hypothetical protein